MSWILDYKELFDTSVNGYQTSDTIPATQFQQILHIFVHFTPMQQHHLTPLVPPYQKGCFTPQVEAFLTKNNLMNPKYK